MSHSPPSRPDKDDDSLFDPAHCHMVLPGHEAAVARGDMHAILMWIAMCARDMPLSLYVDPLYYTDFLI